MNLVIVSSGWWCLRHSYNLVAVISTTDMVLLLLQAPHMSLCSVCFKEVGYDIFPFSIIYLYRSWSINVTFLSTYSVIVLFFHCCILSCSISCLYKIVKHFFLSFWTGFLDLMWNNRKFKLKFKFYLVYFMNHAVNLDMGHCHDQNL